MTMWSLVKELNADGVHLGKNDMPLAEARRRLGMRRIIGATANCVVDIERACGRGRRLYRSWTLPIYDHKGETESGARN